MGALAMDHQQKPLTSAQGSGRNVGNETDRVSVQWRLPLQLLPPGRLAWRDATLTLKGLGGVDEEAGGLSGETAQGRAAV